MKRLWESPDGTTLETLCRPPIAADRLVEALRLPWRLARTMKDDFNAAMSRLQETVRAIAAATREVAGASAEISGGTTNL